MSHSFFPKSKFNSKQGFSLIEILTVLALLAVLGGIVIGSFGGILEDGNRAAAQQFVNQSLDASFLKYKIDTGSYPSTAEGIAVLLTAPANKATKWRGPYIEKMPVDPWQNPYQYRFPGTKNPTKYDLWSFGPDGIASEDDIGNWE